MFLQRDLIKKHIFSIVSSLRKYMGLAILTNTPDQAEILLHILERAAASIGLYVNAHKTEYMCYN